MTRFVGTPLRGIEFSSVSDEAVSARVNGDGQPRIRIDAGGRITWSSGSVAGDTNLYRDSADLLTTDDVFKASGGLVTITTDGAPTAALPDGAVAVDSTNGAFYFRSGGAWTQVTGGGGGASITISDTAPSSPEVGDLWFESDSGSTFVYYDSYWVEIGGIGYGGGDLDGLADVTLTSPTNGQALVYNGSGWVNGTSPNVCTSTTRPTSPFEGQVIYETDTNRVLVYDASAWVMIADTNQPPGLQLVKTQTIGSAVASVTVSDAFSADFDNYRVILNGDQVSSGGNYLLAFTGITGAGLHRQVGYYQSYGASAITAYAADSTSIIAGHASTGGYGTVIDIQNPYKTEVTTGMAQGSSTTTMYSFPFVINSTASTTGFTISGVTFTGGTIRVYGYRN